MFCPNCGFQNSDDSRFCAGCGAPINGAAEPQAQTQNYQQTYQPQYQPAKSNNFMDNIKSYQQPANAIAKTPFPAYILQFIKMGIWVFYFIAIFFAWVFLKVSMWGMSESESLNLFKIIFDKNYSMEGMEGGAFLTIMAILVLLVLVAVVAYRVINLFMPGKLPAIPQIVLCAAPAAITFIFMIVAWIVMGGAMSELGDLASYGAKVSAGPGFGAWLVFILSAAETALHIVFMKDKNAPIMQ